MDATETNPRVAIVRHGLGRCREGNVRDRTLRHALGTIEAYLQQGLPRDGGDGSEGVVRRLHGEVRHAGSEARYAGNHSLAWTALAVDALMSLAVDACDDRLQVAATILERCIVEACAALAPCGCTIQGPDRGTDCRAATLELPFASDAWCVCACHRAPTTQGGA
jgi:hypothetical protein